MGFRFLDLPPEIRNRVYRMHLVADSDIIISPSRTTPHHDPEVVCLGLLLVNRQICNEARGIYYAENTFAFRPSMWDSKAWFIGLLSVVRTTKAKIKPITFFIEPAHGLGYIGEMKIDLNTSSVTCDDFRLLDQDLMKYFAEEVKDILEWDWPGFAADASQRSLFAGLLMDILDQTEWPSDDSGEDDPGEDDSGEDDAGE